LLKIDNFWTHASAAAEDAIPTRKRSEKFQKRTGKKFWLMYLGDISGNGLPNCATLLTIMKRKIQRKSRRSIFASGFHISKKPIVNPAANERFDDLDTNLGLPREYGARILFAIARDPRTIFTSWNIDWPALFEKVVPVDRQVHLRLYGAEGLEKTVVVEPMAAMHYVTTSGAHASYRVEIGYYQPADFWRPVAVSDDIVMPPNDMSEAADVDLATIPFHVAFQQLLDLFKAPSGAALAVAISRFEKRVLSEQPKVLSAKDKTILRKLGVLASDFAAARRAFDEIDRRLARRTAGALEFGPTSPSHARERAWSATGS
jgi:hypothetical protein